MDLTACYCDMLISMQDGDFEAARKHALQLQRWLDGGGYYPPDENMLEVQGHLARVLRITNPDTLPEPQIFSLVCSDCDYGDSLANETEAIEEGWSQIQPAPDLPMANFVGVCPCCRKMLDE